MSFLTVRHTTVYRYSEAVGLGERGGGAAHVARADEGEAGEGLRVGRCGQGGGGFLGGGEGFRQLVLLQLRADQAALWAVPRAGG